MYDNYTDNRPTVVHHAEDAYKATRGLNHATLDARSIPAPVVYDILGNLKTAAGHGMNQALHQMAAGLLRSLDTHDVYDGKGDPAGNAESAAALMREAAELAAQIGTLMETAQVKINSQGYRSPDE